MVQRISPDQYFTNRAAPNIKYRYIEKNKYIPQYQAQNVQTYQTEQVIPLWVQITIVIALVGAFGIAFYAISKIPRK